MFGLETLLATIHHATAGEGGGGELGSGDEDGDQIAWGAGARNGDIVQKYPQNQSDVGSNGQTLTTNVSMTLCNWQICRQTRVLCGCTTFCTELELGSKLIQSLRLL